MMADHLKRNNDAFDEQIEEEYEQVDNLRQPEENVLHAGNHHGYPIEQVIEQRDISEDTSQKNKTLLDYLKASNSNGKPMKSAAKKKRKKGKNGEKGDNEDEEDAEEEEEQPTPKRLQSTRTLPPQTQRVVAPQVRIENGKVVINEASLVLEAPETNMANDVLIATEAITHITSSSYAIRTKAEKWTKADTEDFYMALRRCGTDFSLMEKLFVHRDRRQLKNKYKREEKENPSRIDSALRNRLPMDISLYKNAVERKKLAQKKVQEGNATCESTTATTTATTNSTLDSKGEEFSLDKSINPSKKKSKEDKNKPAQAAHQQSVTAQPGAQEEEEEIMDEETLRRIREENYESYYYEDED